MIRSDYRLAYNGVIYPLSKVFLIGRDKSRCQLLLNDGSVSRIHATLVFDALTETYQIFDGDLMTDRPSRNGLQINSKPLIYSAVLQPRDIITINDQNIIYSVCFTTDDSNGTIT